MEKKNEELENKVDRAMDSIDDLRRARVNPYLYSKIEERLSTTSQRRAVRPNGYKQLGLAFFVLLVTINVFTIIQYTRTESFSSDKVSTLSEAYGWSRDGSSGIYENFNWD